MAAIFADIRTPYINEATLKRIMSNRTKSNIFQGILTKPNEAVTEKFSTDTDAAEIQVIRVKPVNKDAREIGSDTNGGWFNNSAAATPTTAAYPIRILKTVDDLIDIPTNQQDMMNVDLVEAELSNLAGRVNRNINAMTIAAQLCKNFNDIRSTAIANNWVVLGADADYKNAIIDAGTKLDEGNSAEGIDAYPDDMRAIILRPEAKSALLKKGQIIIGGSDSAQRILRNGGVDEETRPTVATTGFLGEIDNMPAYVASPSIWTLAARYLGLAETALNNVKGLVVSAVGTGRALAFNSAIQIGECPLGQGRRIKPKYRFGAECWDGLSVVPIVTEDFTNPATTAALQVIAPGSRT